VNVPMVVDETGRVMVWLPPAGITPMEQVSSCPAAAVPDSVQPV
jgi:hypothetical protein